MKTKINSDVILGVLLIVVSVAIFATASGYPAGAALYLKGLSVLIALLSASVVWTGFKKGQEPDRKDTVTFALVKKPVIVYLMMVVYIAGFRFLGFFVATPIFIFSLLLYLKGGTWKRCLLVAAVFTLLCYVGFVILMKVPLYRVGIFGKFFRWTF